MILHYLGLDHIGHIAGPTSPLVGPKLKEMDNIIKRIYSAMLVWDQESEAPSLLVLCGDHGMSDTGSHGGASSTETNTPLVFMSPLFEQGKGAMLAKKQVQQIDLVPTLSLLLGLPIPQSSIGIAIPNLFQFHSLREMLRAFQLNAHQLSQAVIANDHAVDSVWELQHALKLHSDWLRTSELDQNPKNVEIMADKVAKQYILALEKMSSHMTASLSRYDLHAMVYGIVILVQTFCWVAFGLCALSSQQKTKGELGTSVTSVFLLSGVVLLIAVLHLSVCSSMWIGGGDILCSASSVESFLYTVVFTFQTGVTATSLLLYFSRSKSNHISSISSIFSTFSLLFQSRTHCFLVAGTLLHVLSLLSSSFVEEEHQTWYFFTSTLFIVVFSEKTLPFWTRKKRVNLKTNEETTFLTESVKDEIFSNCKSSKSLDRRKYFINEDCRQGRGTSFDENLDRLEDRNGVNAEAVTSKNGGSSSGRTQIGKSEKEVLWSCFLTVVVLGLGRLRRSWNQTGIKWADIPDIGDWLVKPENKTILSVTYFISLLFIICFRYYRQGFFTSVVFVIGVTHAYLYRTATGNLQLPWLPNKPITKGITEARLTYCCVATIGVWNLIHIYKTRNNEKKQEYIREISVPFEGLVSGFLLLQVLLQRPHNAAMLAVFVVQENLINEILWKSEKMAWVMIVSSLWMGHAMYFSLGNSNSLASVDISAGYVGLEDFVPSLMLILTYFSTYCGPFLWMFSGVLSVVRNAEDVSRLQKSLLQACYVIILCQVSVLCVYCTLVFSQRYHLFVWSVFSPKLLYESTKTLLFTLSVVTVLCLMHFVTRVPRMNFEKTE